MKIQVLSDLHLEFLSSSQIDNLISNIYPHGDVLVLAGDIGNPSHSSYKFFLEKMNQQFPKIFLITGNHEYYGGSISSRNHLIHDICSSLNNVSFLSCSYEDYKGFRWIGTTLWSRVDESTRFRINDVRRIQDFTILHYNQLHQEAVDFLSTTLKNSISLPSIVITHHLPSHQLIHPRYQKEPDNYYNQWFASSLDPLLEKYTLQIPLWIYGHTHDFFHGYLQQTQMVCNPLGYEEEKNPINLHYVVELVEKSV